MVGITASDLQLISYRLMQGSSKAVQTGRATIGTFYSPETGRERESLDCAVLMIRKTRTFWGDNVEAPICSSDDGIIARPNAKFAGQECMKCQYRNDEPWNLPQEQRRKVCTAGYSMLCYDLESESPFLIRVQGKSTQASKVWITAVVEQYNYVPFAAKTVWTSEQRTNAYGTTYVSIPTLADGFSEDQLKKFETLAEQLVGNQIDWSDEKSDSTSTQTGADLMPIIEDDPPENAMF
jgi:hypothetical protein